MKKEAAGKARSAGKVTVFVAVGRDELERMRAAAFVDANGPAVLAMARRGLESERNAAENGRATGREAAMIIRRELAASADAPQGAGR